MAGVKDLICGAWIALVGIAPAFAEDTGASGSFRMRPLSQLPVRAASPPAGKRVGQAPALDPAAMAEADDPEDDAIAPPGMIVVSPLPVQIAPVPTVGTAMEVSALDSDVAAQRASRAAFTVTGSLIERTTLTTPSPLTVLTREDLLAAGRSMIGDILQPLPEQANAPNAQFNNGGNGVTRIDLRGLTAARTLTLLNGRRFVSVGNGADATVDLNTIPLAVIERVEILKDAGSAVYGSDAIGGVVNIITRTGFNGTEASLYTAQTERKDGFTYDASFVTGHRTENRNGHIIFSAGMQRQNPVFAGDRAFSQFDKAFDFNSRTVVNGGSTATPGGRIDARQIDINGDGRGDTVNVCGVGVPFCTSDGRGGYRPFVQPDDLYNFQPLNYLYTPSSRVNAYTAGSFKLDI